MGDLGRGEALRAWLGYRAWTTRWAISSRWLQLRGVSGDFAVGEASERAVRLTVLWESKWAGTEPVGYRVRYDCQDRWVRFHSLPGSKRYANSAEEYSEIVRRHRVVLDELRDGAAVESLVVIGTDYGPRDLATGRTKKALSAPWPWRIGLDPDNPGVPFYFWVTSNLGPAQLDELLLSAADDRAGVFISNVDLDWAYAPYDGGADVVLPSPFERDMLRDRHADWLPDNPSGL